jgi:hypothetical protein
MRVTFVHEDGLSTAQARAVAGEQQLTDVTGLDGDLGFGGGEDGTGCQFARFVEVVDSPDVPSA